MDFRDPYISLEPTVSSLILMYEKIAKYKYEKQCSITKLTSEFLAPAFKCLNTEDRLSVRLVCKFFKETLDQHVGVHVNLDQRKIDSELYAPLPPPGACSIRLWSINSPKYLDYILKRWHLITTVNFAGHINLSAFTKVVTRCRNLKKLFFTDRCHIYSSIVPVRMSQLHTLDIGCPGYSKDYVGGDAVVSSLWLTYEMLLKKLTVPQLKVFRIFFSCVEECSTLHHALAQIFRFVVVHKQVEEFALNLHHRYERFNFLANDMNYCRFRVDVPKKVLRSIQLRKIQTEIMEPAFKIWDSILPGQKSLTHIDIMNRGRKWFYFAKMISNNVNTLVHLRLHNLSPNSTKTSAIDAALFAECCQLKTLFLSRFENSTQAIVYCYPNDRDETTFLDMQTSETPEIENLWRLPATIKNLHIQGLVLSSDDLVATIIHLQNLETLELQLVGYHRPSFYEDLTLNTPSDVQKKLQNFPGAGLGVSVTVIQAVLEHARVLDTFFVEEFENPWTIIRDSDLGKAICSISLMPGDGYFKGGGYYGLLICSEIRRNSGRLTRTERMHLWDVRLSQYVYYQHYKNWEEKLGNEQGLNNVEFSRSPDSCSLVDPVSTTSLLEILDKENGQLEQIQRLLNARTPTPVTPAQIRTEHTRNLVEKYAGTLYSAIPNYHKATRLRKPTEKFASVMSHSRPSSSSYDADVSCTDYKASYNVKPQN